MQFKINILLLILTSPLKLYSAATIIPSYSDLDSEMHLVCMGPGRTVEEQNIRKFIKSAKYGNIEKVKKYLALGVDVNATTMLAETSLMLASKYGYKEIVKLLIDAGANINQVDIYGHTALMHAIIDYRKDIVELLLNEGANLDICDHLKRQAIEHTQIFERDSEETKIIKSQILKLLQSEPQRRIDEQKKFILWKKKIS